jgi:glucose dehydrogenase
MLRVFASLGLMFLAMAGCALAVILIFLFVPWLWESVFGPAWAPAAALAALVVAAWLFAKLMRLADRALDESSGHHAPHALAAARADVPHDWQDYSADIIRNKRWAYYRRTRQFDRLAELEAEQRRAK